MPTTKTRQAGLAALLAPLLVVVGQLGNVIIDRGAGHGAAVALLVLAFPAFVFGLWGLRDRHGGLGRLGRAAFVLALVSPALSMFALYGALYALVSLLAVAVVVFAVEMLRASVLPVAPLVVFATGGIGVLLLVASAAVVTVAGGDFDGFLPDAVLISPLVAVAVGFAWLGWHMWREPAVDQRIPGRSSLAGA